MARLQALAPDRRAAVEELLKKRGLHAGPRAADGAAIPRVARAPGAQFPLSFDQRRIWYLHQLDPQETAFNVQAHAVLCVPVDVIERALNAVVARHEILRATYRMVGDEPVQEIAEPRPVTLEVVDLSSLGDGEVVEPALAAMNAQRDRVFDLASGPVWRACAVRLSGGRSAFAMTVHHIATDGWSMNRLAAEMRELCDALASGRSPRLAQLPVQYVDYAAWQRRCLRGEALEEKLAYWRERLEGMPAMLELPTDFPRPPMPSSHGKSVTVQLSAEVAAGLRAVARRGQATLYMVALALFKILLARHTGRYDIVVGTPVAGRSLPGLEDVHGLFTNSLVLRTRLAPDLAFAEALARVRDTVLGALAHDDVPFDKVVEALQPHRSLSRNPLFQAFFTKPIVDRFADEPETIEAARHHEAGYAEFDVGLWVEEYAHSVRLTFHYNADLFEPVTVERWAARYVTLAEAASRDDDGRIGALDVLGEDGRRALLVDWNATEAAVGPEPVSRLFEACARQAPQKTALAFEGETLTYAELDARANRLAHHLRSFGVGPEVKVGLHLERGVAMVVAVLAVMKAGGGYLPLDPSYPRERLQFMLHDGECRVLITQERLRGAIAAGDAAIVSVDGDSAAIAAQPAQCLESAPQGHDLAYMIYTSGSTGVPKGVQVEHRALANFVHAMARSPGIAAGDVLVAVTTLSFDIAALELYVPLATGATVVLASREDAGDGLALARLLERSSATVMQATPATWRLLLAAGWKGMPALKALCGGEAMSRELADQLLARCGEVWNLYGPTETTVWSSIHRVQPGQGHVPIGRPIANTQMYVLDERYEPVPPGAVGELCIGGAGVSRGYWRRDELTAQRFVDNPFAAGRIYRTGDLARHRGDGVIECLGRMDTQVKLRGFRIELGEIESVLQRVAGVAAAAVAMREDRPGDQRLVAYVVRSEDGVTADALRAAAAGRLPAYMVPAAWVFLEALPLTPNGKTDRKALPVPGADARADRHFAAPATPMERVLAEVWTEVLDVERVGVHDNFFDLGGHSLLAMKSIARFRERTGMALPPRDFYIQTLGQLAASVDRHAGTRPRAPAAGSFELEPFHFGNAERKLFGLIRRPAGTARAVGVVLCPPHAHEYVRTHRAFRELAQRLAQSGFPVLSFDYFGTGDSFGEYEDARLAGWEQDATAAIDELERRAQVDSVCIVGLRLGATIALSVAAREDVRAAALWDPIAHGDDVAAELAEIRSMQALDPDRQHDLYFSDTLAYPLTDALSQDIEGIDLCAGEPRRELGMLVVETGAEGTGRRLADVARACGASAEYRRLDEARVWAREPYQAIVPRAALAALHSWIVELAP
ncbi:MAG TPA: amino acid adenylation domain-containing protein [Usitatibacter sp.]|nr:amino acid adenylation domain-containing protein [Usitatibacter sp.]